MSRAVVPLVVLAATVPIWAAAPSSLHARQAAPAPHDSSDGTVLFDSTEPLQLTITVDLHTLLRDIDSLDRQEHEGQIAYVESNGAEKTLDVKLRTRGHFRRQPRNCNFPPLRLNLKKSQLPGTIFQNQDKLKLVTHCQRGRDNYEQNVLKEYLVYRIYNHLSDASFRVRLAHITYRDTTGREEPETRYGFLIEDEDELAARLGGEIVEGSMAPEMLNPDLLAIIDVFEYMVGNTDWSVIGLHNIMIIRTPSDNYPVPFDFDWTGLVDARYAKPDARLDLRSVRQRLYRGLCRSQDDFQRIFDWFIAQRDSVYGEVTALEGLDEREARNITEYLDEFYDTLNNPGKVRREFMRRCR